MAFRTPTPEQIRSGKLGRLFGPRLADRRLWTRRRRSVALGMAVGVFFGFLIPVLQIGAAALLAVLLRANLPVAAFATLVSNPLTYAPIAVLAYRTGAALLGERVDAAAVQDLEVTGAEQVVAPAHWLDSVEAIGLPLFTGLAVFAVVGALVAWLVVYVAWTLGVWLKRRQRRARPATP